MHLRGMAYQGPSDPRLSLPTRTFVASRGKQPPSKSGVTWPCGVLDTPPALVAASPKWEFLGTGPLPALCARSGLLALVNVQLHPVLVSVHLHPNVRRSRTMTLQIIDHSPPRGPWLMSVTPPADWTTPTRASTAARVTTSPTRRDMARRSFDGRSPSAGLARTRSTHVATRTTAMATSRSTTPFWHPSRL